MSGTPKEAGDAVSTADHGDDAVLLDPTSPTVQSAAIGSFADVLSSSRDAWTATEKDIAAEYVHDETGARIVLFEPRTRAGDEYLPDGGPCRCLLYREDDIPLDRAEGVDREWLSAVLTA